MSHPTNSAAKTIWNKMDRKAYRDAYVSAHLSNTIAAQISIMRERRGWTQAELAKRAGMKQPRISTLEDPNNENVEAETLRRLASAFDVGLTIRFVPHSELVEWSATLNDEKLAPPSHGEDSMGDTETSSSDNISVGIIGGIIGGVGSRTVVPGPLGNTYFIPITDSVPAHSTASDFIKRYTESSDALIAGRTSPALISAMRVFEIVDDE